MFDESRLQEQETLATERGRSPSGVASVGGPAAPPDPVFAADSTPGTSPPLPTAASPATPPVAETSAANGLDGIPVDETLLDEGPFPEEPFEEMRRPRLVGVGKSKGRRLVQPEQSPQSPMTPAQRLLILDTWQRSGLPAGDFATLVGMSKHTLYADAKVAVPHEVGVLGVGNDEITCELSSPPLSSIDQNATLIGDRAAAMMLGLLAGETPPKSPVVVPPRCAVVRESTGVTVSADAQLAAVLGYIWENAQELREVDDVCREFKMSRRHLEMLCKNGIGRGPAAEILRVRVEHAKTLLAETNEPLKSVAASIGFRSLCHFAYVFHRLAGETPGNYRTHHRAR